MRFSRKSLVALALWGLLLFVGLSYALQYDKPKEPDHYRFYATECGDNLKFLVADTLKSAKSSLSLATFGLSDRDIIAILEERADSGVAVEVSYDRNHSRELLSTHGVRYLPIRKQGLMHRKILTVDDQLILLGSANLTLTSLIFHRNFITAIQSRPLVQAVQHNQLFKGDRFSYFPLPEQGKAALACLKSALANATKRIYLAIFTLTYPPLIEELILAKQRGIDVQVYIDRTVAKGASRGAVKKLREAGIAVTPNRGYELLHHKCALIDDRFFLGSANWTKAAFTKNEDYLLHFTALNASELTYLENFFMEMRRSLRLPKSSTPVS